MTAPLEPSDLALLIVLGTADRNPVSLAEIASTAKLLAPQDWQPTTETIGAAVERALTGRLVALGGEGAISGTGVETTSLGRSRIVDLLFKPIPGSTGGFLRACMAAKLHFLHHVPHPKRSNHAEELAQLYRDAIAFMRRIQQLPRPLAGSALDDLREEMFRMESELAWLDGMAAWQPHQQAAE